MRRFFGKGGHKNSTAAPLLGRMVQVSSYRLKVEALLGEGGFASIYRVKDSVSGEPFAMKHIVLDGPEMSEAVRHEAKCMKKLKGHRNVVRLVAVGFGSDEKGQETDAYMLMDLCTDTLYEFLQRHEFSLPDATVLEVFHSACNAIEHMHQQNPPITHRDVKVENVLRRPNGDWVMCDFGSASTKCQVFEDPTDIAIEEENIGKYTTPAYRPPEMWDLMMGHRIDTKVDIWALGCMLYLLCFGKLPFTGESKLHILSGKFVMPATRPAPIRSLIADILIADPSNRPDIQKVLLRLEQTKQAIVSLPQASASGGASRRSSFSAVPIGVNRPGSVTEQNSPVRDASWERVDEVKMATAGSLPNPSYLTSVINSVVEQEENDVGRKEGKGWADFDNAQWQKGSRSSPGFTVSAQAGAGAGYGGMAETPSRRKHSAPVGSQVADVQNLLTEFKLLRTRLKDMHEENQALSGRVLCLEDKINTQQAMILQLQNITMRQQAQMQALLSPRSPVIIPYDMDSSGRQMQSTIASSTGGSGQYPQQAAQIHSNGHYRGRESDVPSQTAQYTYKGETSKPRQQYDSPVTPSRYPSSNQPPTSTPVVRSRPSGSFWETYGQPSESPPPPPTNTTNTTNTTADAVQLHRQSDMGTITDSDSLKSATKHRRIVSDPPPLDSWHLDELE